MPPEYKKDNFVHLFSLLLYNESKENQNGFISCSYALRLQKMQGKFIRVRPKNFTESEMFFNLFNMGLVNNFKGGHEWSGVAQRAEYEIIIEKGRPRT